MQYNHQISVEQISALGTANGQVLASNGTSVYWTSGGTGYDGSVGFTGSTGSTGYTGSKGDTGYTGSQGNIGYTGSLGFTGSKGDLGYTGSKGATGDFGGAAFNYVFSTNTTHTSTPNGYFNFNNTTFTSATTLFIDYIDNLGANSYSFLQTIDDSTSAIKGHFSVRDTANSLNYAMFAITGTHTEDIDHFDIPVSYLSGVTSFTNSTNTVITFARTGNIGDTGYTGSTGSLGYTGSTGSLGYTGSIGVGYTGSAGSIGYTGSTATSNAVSTQYTANGTQTTFALTSNAVNQNNFIISLNGLVQYPVTHYTISGNTLSFTFTPPNNSIVEVRDLENGSGVVGYTGSQGPAGGYTGSIGSIGYTGSTGPQGTIGYTGSIATANASSQTFTGNGSNTVYTLSASVANHRNIIVTLDGLVQVPNTHYTISGTTLTFTSVPVNNTSIEIRNFETGTGQVGYTGSAGTGGSTVNISDTFVSVFLLGL